MPIVDELDRIVCPNSGEKLIPDVVREYKDPKTKELRRTGVFKKHHHQFRECDYSGLAGPVVRIPSPKEVQPPASSPQGPFPGVIYYDDRVADTTSNLTADTDILDVLPECAKQLPLHIELDDLASYLKRCEEQGLEVYTNDSWAGLWWRHNPAAVPEPLTMEKLEALDQSIDAVGENDWVEDFYARLAHLGYTGPTD